MKKKTINIIYAILITLGFFLAIGFFCWLLVTHTEIAFAILIISCFVLAFWNIAKGICILITDKF